MQNDANAARTNAHESTEGVPAFTLPADLKHHMRALRKKVGASSAIGRRASNVEEALHNLEHGIEPGPTGEFQRANLEKSIRRQLTDIARLAGG